jgi:hypothetical protein
MYRRSSWPDMKDEHGYSGLLHRRRSQHPSSVSLNHIPQVRHRAEGGMKSPIVKTLSAVTNVKRLGREGSDSPIPPLTWTWSLVTASTSDLSCMHCSIARNGMPAQFHIIYHIRITSNSKIINTIIRITIHHEDAVSVAKAKTISSRSDAG